MFHALAVLWCGPAQGWPDPESRRRAFRARELHGAALPFLSRASHEMAVEGLSLPETVVLRNLQRGPLKVAEVAVPRSS